MKDLTEYEMTVAVEAAAQKFTKEIGGDWNKLGNHQKLAVKEHLLPAVVAALEAVPNEREARAWNEGMRTGTSRAMRRMSDEPELPLASEDDNPYREQ